jgi:hypothetical protein
MGFMREKIPALCVMSVLALAAVIGGAFLYGTYRGGQG